jgi:hypothetical protein
MFDSITWEEYLIFILVGSFIYYVYIILRYYRNELYHMLKGIRKTPVIAAEKKKTISPGNAKMNDLLEELKILFQSASKRKYLKEELMSALKLKLIEYRQFRNTPFETAVSNFIATESDNQCSIHLSDDDQRVIWIG